MRKFFLRVATAMAVMLTAFCANAQEMSQPIDPDMLPKAPVDSAVIKGQLPNGITYYIRHNETPKGQADFFIAQNVGSILEDEDQRGLAHFLEHMCFNGTENFPGNGVIDWLESQGVKFGYNLNAYTGLDETVYNISNVPLKSDGIVDSCLLVLHDWADGLLLDSMEIDKERGVIHQEWRRSMVGQMRILEKLLPQVYPGSKYGERLPIGLMSVVDHFKPQVLRNYYEKWYRPDNQAIIVVGDVDPKAIQAKIENIFDPIQMPENPAPRVWEQVPDTPGTIYAIGSDKEQSASIANMFFKLPQQLISRDMNGTVASFPMKYLEYMIAAMMNERYSDMASKPDCPFAAASIDVGQFFISPTKDALSLEVIGKGNDIRPAFEAAYRELLRAAKNGFTQSEYDRAKAQYLASYERQYEQRAGRDNTSYAREYAANFTKNEPIPGIEYELEMAKQVAAQIPFQAFQQLLPELISRPDNRVFMALLPETPETHIVTEPEMAELISKVEAEDLAAYEDNTKTEPLVPSLSAPVEHVVSENATFGTTELTYPNGVKVIMKKTDFKPGEIKFEATARGGYGYEPISDATRSLVSGQGFGLMVYGLGSYTNTDLEKYLKGKNTSLSFDLDPNERGLVGSTTPKNLPTLMELIHMAFVDARIYDDEFNSLKEQLKSILANQAATPDFKAQQGWYKSLYKYGNSYLPTPELLDQANAADIQGLLHTMYANPGNFTFTFVGDIDTAELTKLCNEYLGNLRAPRIAAPPTKAAPDYEPLTGPKDTAETTVMETPQTTVYITLTGKLPYNAKNALAASAAGQILSNRLLKTIREDMGAVYSIGAGSRLSRLTDQNFFLYIPFPMKPEMQNEVLAKVKELTEDMANNITDEEFNPIREYMVKQAREDAEKNGSWLNAISGVVLNNVDTFTNAEANAAALTKEDVKALMKDILSQKNYRAYTLSPAAK